MQGGLWVWRFQWNWLRLLLGKMNNNMGLEYMIGLWSEESSKNIPNYRELLNLFEIMEKMCASASLQGKENFIFIDNSTCNDIYYKGKSSSRKIIWFDYKVKESGSPSQ